MPSMHYCYQKMIAYWCIFFKVMATFLKIVFCLKRYCIWWKDACCRDFLCSNVFLPSRSIVPSSLWNGSVLMFQLTKQCLFTYWEKHYLIDMKSDMFKKSDFLQRNATYWKGKFFLLRECYTFWMKVSVCKTCTCQLGLLLERKDSCLIVFCGKVIHSVFTAFSSLGKRPKVETLFM